MDILVKIKAEEFFIFFVIVIADYVINLYDIPNNLTYPNMESAIFI